MIFRPRRWGKTVERSTETLLSPHQSADAPLLLPPPGAPQLSKSHYSLGNYSLKSGLDNASRLPQDAFTWTGGEASNGMYDNEGSRVYLGARNRREGCREAGARGPVCAPTSPGVGDAESNDLWALSHVVCPHDARSLLYGFCAVHYRSPSALIRWTRAESTWQRDRELEVAPDYEGVRGDSAGHMHHAWPTRDGYYQVWGGLREMAMKPVGVAFFALLFLLPQGSTAAAAQHRGLSSVVTGTSLIRFMGSGSTKGERGRPGLSQPYLDLLKRMDTTERTSISSMRPNSVSVAPAAFDSRQLRVPDSAFSPATIVSQYDYPLDANGANSVGMRMNHWWDYARLGMLTGYFELGGATTIDTGDLVGFAWQASVFKDVTTAYNAFADGANRTGQWGPTVSCQSTLNVPCKIISYPTVDGGFASYSVLQVRNCTGEVKAFSGNPAVLQSDGQTIDRIAATVFVVGFRILEQLCTGSYGGSHPAATTTKPGTPAPTMGNAPIQPGFTGNCFTFRGVMWGYAQQASQLISDYWSLLQKDYNNNYPPQTGGSTPGYTQAQFQQAQVHMAALQRAIWNKRAGTGLMMQVAATGHQYGITDISKPGPANWAANRLFGALDELRVAGHEEWVQAGTGLSDYQQAQMLMSNTWDALKQLPCH